jgi:uncharacterized protein involved in propanediol utilization
VVEVQPPNRIKACRAAQETLAALGGPCTGGYLTVASQIPPGRGYGSSTSDVLAAILAVLHAVNEKLSAAEVAAIAVRAETASDPLMFADRTVLFAQREGKIIEEFGLALPRLAVLGFATGDSGIDTLGLPPPRYTAGEIGEFADLLDMTRTGLASADPSLLGAVASASTAINQRYLPMAGYELLQPLVRRAGAVGLQTAHSGNVAGLIFDGAEPGHPNRQLRARALLADVGITATWSFTVGGTS